MLATIPLAEQLPRSEDVFNLVFVLVVILTLLTEQSRLHGVEVAELRLPAGTSVSLVVRGGTSFTPDRQTPLRHGDDLLVVTPRGDRDSTERRLQGVSRGGRLAGWVGDQS